MKPILAFTAGLLLAAAPFQARADAIFILKDTESFASSFYNEDNPVNDAFGNNPAGAIAPKGYAVMNGTFSNSSYLIINLSTNEVVDVSYYIHGGYDGIPASKVMNVSAPQPLSNYFDSLVPLKTAKSFLWNFQHGSEYEQTSFDEDLQDYVRGADTDGDGFIDDYYSSFSSAQLKGTGVPFVVSSTLTLQNVPTSLKGTVNWTLIEDFDTVTRDFGDGPETFDPYRSFETMLTTSTMTLDSPMSKAANLTAIQGTTDLGFSGSLTPGTFQNAIQRVRNLLYAMGYRIPTPD